MAIIIKDNLSYEQALPYLNYGYFLSRFIWNDSREIHRFGSSSFIAVEIQDNEKTHEFGCLLSEEDKSATDWQVKRHMDC